MKRLFIILPILTAAFLLQGLQCLIAQDAVIIYGNISVVRGDLENLHFVVYGENIEPVKVPINKKGKFIFELPVDEVAMVRCSKPDYLTKRVRIDTHHAFATKVSSRYNKAVDFGLEMVPQSFKYEMEYEKPVANITFNERSGLLKIQYRYRKQRLIATNGLMVDR